jgi:hypothetical protein
LAAYENYLLAASIFSSKPERRVDIREREVASFE